MIERRHRGTTVDSVRFWLDILFALGIVLILYFGSAWLVGKWIRLVLQAMQP